LEESRLCALRLSKAGYGKVSEILETDADIVVDMLNYEGFLTDYEKVFMDINKDNK
jgi:hypothetical protein